MGTLSGTRTTPEATEVQRVLAGVRDRQRSDGLRHAVAMEVSSHALVQSRVEGIHFDVAVFTNLSHDHLDYHGTMEEYFEAKALLFTPSHALRGVVHADDAWGRRLLERARIPTVAVHHSDATDLVLRPGHSEFTWRGQRITTPLTGAINVDNALLAAEAALALEDLELGPEEIARAMAHLAPVPGRLQVIAAPGAQPPSDAASPSFTVLVDYAHTPAGLEVVLGEARTLAPAGRVLCVFGCGGNRDRAKRPLMGAAAAHLSDLAFVTSDNPRDEDPLAIIEEVLAGIPGGRANAAGRGRARSRAWPSGWPSRPPAPATWSSSPARATRRTRRSPAGASPSTTRSRHARPSPGGSGPTREPGPPRGSDGAAPAPAPAAVARSTTAPRATRPEA